MYHLNPAQCYKAKEENSPLGLSTTNLDLDKDLISCLWVHASNIGWLALSTSWTKNYVCIEAPSLEYLTLGIAFAYATLLAYFLSLFESNKAFYVVLKR